MTTYPLICSSPVGIIKCFNLKDQMPLTISLLQNQSVTSLCWHSTDSYLVGTKKGVLIQQFCTSSSSNHEPFDTLDESIASILPNDEVFLAVSTTGTVRSYDRSTLCRKTEVKVNSSVCCARISHSLLATGGRNSNLAIWDLDNPTHPVFSAKNVRQTTLQLEVPIWISDICFVPNYDGRIVLTTSRYGEICLYDIRCGQRRPVSRHAWRTSRKYGKVKVGTCSHGAILPDLAVTRPITRGLAFTEAPGIGVRIVAGNAIGDLCFLDLRLPKESIMVADGDDDESPLCPGQIKSRGARAPEPPVGVCTLPGASGSITGLACGGAGFANSPVATPTALFESQPVLIASSLDRYLRIYNRDTGDRLAKLYAKLPITSFLISDSADFSAVERLSGQTVEKAEADGKGDVNAEEASESEEEFDELWNQLEPVNDEAMDGEPKRKKSRRKRGD
ncbi:hypothetical protein CRM22_007846 [Opisthorchis felineus]|uniref:WD repeat-containing protein 74 n=1 Tax=Opisthorchis felineus TaxID=147828 RepID=A0A4S2LE89_OPIFE|nr:hypothetical protein CRM22_007846 [Opisthorchis felineus]